MGCDVHGRRVGRSVTEIQGRQVIHRCPETEGCCHDIDAFDGITETHSLQADKFVCLSIRDQFEKERFVARVVMGAVHGRRKGGHHVQACLPGLLLRQTCLPHVVFEYLSTPVPRIPLNFSRYPMMLLAITRPCLFAVETQRDIDLLACDHVDTLDAVTACINVGIAGFEVLIRDDPACFSDFRPASLASVALGRTPVATSTRSDGISFSEATTRVTTPSSLPTNLVTRTSVRISTPRNADIVSGRQLPLHQVNRAECEAAFPRP